MRPMSLKANELLTEVSQGSAVLSMKKQIAEKMEQLDESHCAAKRPAGSAPEGERGRSRRLPEQTEGEGDQVIDAVGPPGALAAADTSGRSKESMYWRRTDSVFLFPSRAPTHTRALPPPPCRSTA